MKSSSGGLGNIFNKAVVPDAAPQVTLMAALAPQMTFPKIVLNDTLKVNAHQHAAASLVAPNLKALGGVQTAIDQQRVAMAETIRQAQREVAMAMKAEGGDVASVFPDMRIGDAGEAGLLLEMAAGPGMNVAGQGSFVTALSNVPTLDTFWSDRQDAGAGRAQILAATEQRLRAMSAAPIDSRMKMPGLGDLMAGDTKHTGRSQFDWNGFFDAGYKLDDLMSVDAKEPHQLPEFRQLQAADHKAGEIENSLLGVRNDLNKQGSTIGAGDVMLAAQGLEIRGAKIDPEDAKALKEAPLLAKRLEPDMDTLLPRPDARPAPGMGMAA